MMLNANQKYLDKLSSSVLLNGLHDEIVILDSTGVIVATNHAWRQFCAENGGNTDHHYLGFNYLGICQNAAGDSSAEASVIPDGLGHTLETGEVFKCEYPCDSPDKKRWFEMTANRIEHDEQHYLIVQHRNITVRHIQRESIEQAVIDANTLAALVATTSDAILSYDLNCRIITWNQAAEKLYGFTAEETIGQTLDIIFPPDWPTPMEHYRDEIIAGRLEQFEVTRIAKDGTPRNVWVSSAPIRSAAGDIVAISNIHRDVSEMRKAEETREIMAREASHRAKNLLSVVSVIQRQTALGSASVKDFSQKFEARIQSLAGSTDLLVKSQSKAVSVADLVARQLEPFTTNEDKRVHLSGPAVRLAPQSVQMMGMAIHELATNASKHGAFVQDEGKIAIEWAIRTDGSALNFVWNETCRTPSSGAEQDGFGTRVLISLAPSMLDTESDYRIEDGSVVWSISIPEEHFSSS